MQAKQCGVAFLVMWHVVDSVVLGNPDPPILQGKHAWYDHVVFSNGEPTAVMADTGRDILRRAMQTADLPAWQWGLLAHYQRHEFAIESRVCHSMSVHETKQSAGWGNEVWSKVYAQVASSNSVANRAGFTSRATYMVLHLILDPSQIEEFKEMVLSLFAEAEANLAKMQLVSQFVSHAPLSC